jgi:hypothetical protein
VLLGTRFETAAGAQVIVKFGVGAFAVTVEITVLPSASTTVTVAVPAVPVVVPVNKMSVGKGKMRGLPPTPIIPVSLE